jgi:hypothetical protein
MSFQLVSKQWLFLRALPPSERDDFTNDEDEEKIYSVKEFKEMLARDKVKAYSELDDRITKLFLRSLRIRLQLVSPRLTAS